MRPISRRTFLGRVNRLGPYKAKIFRDCQTLAIDMPGRFVMISAPYIEGKKIGVKCSAKTEFLLGMREVQLPLNARDKSRKSICSLLQTVRKARFAILSGSETEEIIQHLLAIGRSTNDDAYILPIDGSFLLYTSHHDKLLAYLPQLTSA